MAGAVPASSVAVLAVPAHGRVLQRLDAALMAGTVTPDRGGIAAITLLEIVVSFTVTAARPARWPSVLGAWPARLPDRNDPAAPLVLRWPRLQGEFLSSAW